MCGWNLVGAAAAASENKTSRNDVENVQAKNRKLKFQQE